VSEPEFTAEQVRAKLWNGLSSKRVNAHNQQTLAKAIGVSYAFLNDVLHGRREPTGKILEYLGLERVVIYRIPKRPSERR
jgi:transcriptional regulator with XRE-family HTH domain